MILQIGIADDHSPFLQSMSMLIGSFTNMQVVLQGINGQDLLDKLTRMSDKPRICLIDVNMPVLNGPATIERMSREYPDIKTIAMSMQAEDAALIRMLHAGCRGWWLKYFSPDELEAGIREVDQYGWYNADALNVYHRRQPGDADMTDLQLTVLERRLLELSCTEYSGDEINAILGGNEADVKAVQDLLYAKLHVRSRLGAAMEGIRRGICR